MNNPLNYGYLYLFEDKLRYCWQRNARNVAFQLGLRKYRMRHGPILHFDAAERMKRRILQEKSNKMSAFSVVET